MKTLFAAILSLGTVLSVSAFAAEVDWSSGNKSVSVRANKSARIVVGCTKYDIAPGEWVTDGSSMSATVHTSRPRKNADAKVKATVRDNGDLSLKIGKARAIILKSGPSRVINRCPFKF
jgi:hypothetical protein